MRVLKVSEEYENKNQSWRFEGIYRSPSDVVRVDVRKNAYLDQSHAHISVWSANGWQVFCSLPVSEWFASTPNYTKKTLERTDKYGFTAVRDRLLGKLALGFYNSSEVEMRGE